MERVFLSLGSNVGDRQQNLRQAMAELSKLSDTKLVQASSLYRTQPVDRIDQPEFLNAAAEIETGWEPEELLAALQGIEALLGRVRQERWGPRTLDLDIIYYGSRILKSPRLEIPHPRAQQRAFVLAPLAEIAGSWVDPVLGITVREMWERLKDSGQSVQKLSSGPSAGQPWW